MRRLVATAGRGRDRVVAVASLAPDERVTATTPAAARWPELVVGRRSRAPALLPPPLLAAPSRGSPASARPHDEERVRLPAVCRSDVGAAARLALSSFCGTAR